MPGTDADPQTIRENIERAKQRRDAAQLELDEAVRELQWWRDGLAMFDPAGAGAEQAEELADMEIRRLVPGGFTRSPTTRQLILFAILGAARRCLADRAHLRRRGDAPLDRRGRSRAAQAHHRHDGADGAGGSAGPYRPWGLQAARRSHRRAHTGAAPDHGLPPRRAPW